MEPISQPQILTHDVLAYIFAESIDKNRSYYGRLNLILLDTIASLSREWQTWVLSPNNIMISALKIDNIQLALENPLLSKSVRCFYGIINQKLVERGEKWFTYINLIEKGEKAIAPLNINPNICNFDNKSPVNFVIPLLLKDHNKYEFLVEGLLHAGVTAASFTKAIPTIFSYGFGTINESRFKFADDFISKILTMSDNTVTPTSIVQPFVGQIMCAKVPNYEITHRWLKEKGCLYNAEDLAYRLTHVADRYNSQDFLEIFRLAIESREFKVDAPLKCGNHLIHLILDSTHSRKEEFLDLILQKAPKEIYCKNDEEWSLLSFLVKEPNLIAGIKSFIDEDWLFEQKEHCHKVIIYLLLKPRLVFNFTLFEQSHHYRILNYLQKIKEIFDSEKSFENWLLSPYEDSLLHKIAFLSPSFINLMMENNLISEKDCELKNSDGQTVNDIVERHNKLFAALLCKWEIHEFEQNSIDHDAYINFMKEMPIDSDKKFIFHLLKACLDGYGDTTKQRMLLDRLFQCCGFDIMDDEGNTLLHTALTSLMSHDDNPNREEVREIVAFLIDHGVNPHKKNKYGESALDLAKKYNFKSINEML